MNKYISQFSKNNHQKGAIWLNKKVLILSGSPRKNGNSDLLCDEFLKGALEAGNNAEKYFYVTKTLLTATGVITVKKAAEYVL